MADPTEGVVPRTVEWPTLPFPASVATVIVILMSVLLVVIANRFDNSGGIITVSVLVVAAFISVNFTGILYGVPQTPINEIMIGALATSLGAVIAFWMSGKK